MTEGSLRGPSVSEAGDRAERLRALDPTGSFIVEAPAGSGKTALLIHRFLTLLATPDVEEPESIIAITFTRKAAGEMRHRLISALQDANRPDPDEPASLHEQQARALARRVLERDRQRDWQLVDNPSRLRIQTIDSLCATVTRRMPWISRMGAPPQPEENPSYLYAQAARATLELLDSDGVNPDRVSALTTLLRHLDNNVGRVAGLLAEMLRRRDQWLRHVVRNPTTDAFRDAIEAALNGIVTGELEQLERSFPDDALVETVTHARYAAANLVEEGSRSPIVDCLDLDGLPGSGDLKAWLGLGELFLTRNGKRRTQLDRRHGFPPNKEGRIAKRGCLEIDLDNDSLERLHRVRLLPPTTVPDTQWKLLQALVELLPVAVGQLKLAFQATGKVDFTEIAHACRQALGTPEAPTDLAFALDCRIRHLLIDEFQDTSQGQFDLIESLTTDWQSNDGRTLFLVGDPMQSIYRFREAEVGLFLRARQHGVGNVRLTPLRLSVNFRSSSGIVEWVNRALGDAFPAEEDTFTGAVTYTPAVAFDDPHHASVAGTDAAPDASADRSVRIYPSFDKDSDSEAAEVLEIIRRTRAPDTGPGAGTIAVLVRSRGHLIRTVAALRRAGERFRAVEIDALGTRPVVRDLLALTRALLHPADRVSWLSVLRAPWCGLTLADLHALAGGDRSSAVWDLMHDPARCQSLSENGQQRLSRVRGTIGDAIDRRGTMPVRRWVEGVWVGLGGPACLDSPTGLEDAAAFLDLLEESVRGADIEDEREFELAVDKLYARPDVEADEGLQLLTIHKAKGLEFDTVILPGLGRWVRGEDSTLMMWLEYVDRQGIAQLLMAPIRETGSDDDPLYAYLRWVQSIRSEHESTRLLYVAATRARRSLHLLGHAQVTRHADGRSVKPPGSRSLLRKIWASVEDDYRRVLAHGPMADGSSGEGSEDVLDGRPNDGLETPRPVRRRLRLGWETPRPGPVVEWPPGGAAVSNPANPADPAKTDDGSLVNPTFDWASELQRRVGIVVHSLLQRTFFESSETGLSQGWNRETVLAALRTEGLDGEKLSEACRRVEGALRGALTDERGRWILSGHEEDRREYAISAVTKGRLQRFVLDRTFVDDGVRWIVDYKTGVHYGGGVEAFLDNERERYRAQLENYAEAIQRIDSRPIRLGLYFPLLRAWREWAFEPSDSANVPVPGF